MYTKGNKIITSRENLCNYIEGKDIYNSKFLMMLQDPKLEKIVYEITTYSYRPDLIAQEVYGSVNYMGLVMLQVGCGLEYLKRGYKFYLVSPKSMSNILMNI